MTVHKITQKRRKGIPSILFRGIIGGRQIAAGAVGQSRVQFWAKKDTAVPKNGVLNGFRVVSCLFFAVFWHDGLPNDVSDKKAAPKDGLV